MGEAVNWSSEPKRQAEAGSKSKRSSRIRTHRAACRVVTCGVARADCEPDSGTSGTHASPAPAALHRPPLAPAPAPAPEPNSCPNMRWTKTRVRDDVTRAHTRRSSRAHSRALYMRNAKLLRASAYAWRVLTSVLPATWTPSSSRKHGTEPIKS